MTPWAIPLVLALASLAVGGVATYILDLRDRRRARRCDHWAGDWQLGMALHHNGPGRVTNGAT